MERYSKSLEDFTEVIQTDQTPRLNAQLRLHNHNFQELGAWSHSGSLR